jgi:aspartokinase/homoserine dehydrogenase 1
MSLAKLVIILAREAGLHLELDEIPIQSLVPKPLRVSPSFFLFVCQLLSGGLDVN